MTRISLVLFSLGNISNRSRLSPVTVNNRWCTTWHIFQNNLRQTRLTDPPGFFFDVPEILPFTLSSTLTQMASKMGAVCAFDVGLHFISKKTGKIESFDLSRFSVFFEPKWNRTPPFPITITHLFAGDNHGVLIGLHCGSKKRLNFSINLRKLSIFSEPKWSLVYLPWFSNIPPPMSLLLLTSYPPSHFQHHQKVSLHSWPLCRALPLPQSHQGLDSRMASPDPLHFDPLPPYTHGRLRGHCLPCLLQCLPRDPRLLHCFG